MWNAANVRLLKTLWAKGHSSGQIAAKLNCSRSAVCAKLQRLGLQRRHAPPTAKPKIVKVPKVVAHPSPPHAQRPLARVEFTKRQLYEMLAAAVRNTG
jgi:GcrA cell cycle regulator